MQAQENLIRGVIDIVILLMLEKRDMYGYELFQAVKDRSGGEIAIKDGSLYPVMYRMVSRDYVRENTVLVGKRRTRKYYHITDLGKEHLHIMLEEFNRLRRGLDNIVNSKETN
ncbi:MAG: PadR family transcriptional regulator [Alistipes sp.]|nr:PadR family transcriptional regulator [Alistipes sp.]